MRIRKSAAHRVDKVEIQMTPMIDIVFQLLAFFLMTFKITTLEGDFNIKMPAQAPSAGPVEFPPLRVQLVADAQGNLAAIRLGDRPLTGFDALHREILGLVGSPTGPNPLAGQLEVELDADYNLRYVNTVDAITAISGYVNKDGHVVKLIEKLRFTPPEPPPE
ncbi:MAG: biopolymer transporter ExbD [Pirellulales bacterium]